MHVVGRYHLIMFHILIPVVCDACPLPLADTGLHYEMNERYQNDESTLGDLENVLVT